MTSVLRVWLAERAGLPADPVFPTAAQAALMIRDIVRNTDVPPHIRWRAAQALARMSPLCRDEARQALTHLRAPGWGSSNLGAVYLGRSPTCTVG